ncbi:hypothetical protein DL93DRAFT_2080685 [Clavulina sp. PMI_390]|nr:hypothetical protein DL93DRAFT_2080685 [Clavulina sp. PMI_390]
MDRSSSRHSKQSRQLSPEPGPPTPRGSSLGRSAIPLAALQPEIAVPIPPWAHDEEELPDDPDDSIPTGLGRSASRIRRPDDASASYFGDWDSSSINSDGTRKPSNRWWVFTGPRRWSNFGSENQAEPMQELKGSRTLPPIQPINENHPEDPPAPGDSPTSPTGPLPDFKGKGKAAERIGMRTRLKTSVLSAADSAQRWRHPSRRNSRAATFDSTQTTESPIALHDRDATAVESSDPAALAGTSTLGRNPSRLHIPDLPPPVKVYTMAQANTPGWNIPWATMDAEQHENDNAYPSSLSDAGSNVTGWARRKRRFERFILHNNLTPFLLRILNLAFTSTTLGIAISERLLEKRYNVLGIIGSSINLNILFAPLTILHVLVAIYLEYFGRPLGLWRTSAKLFHTLSETVFICLWSAALSTSADNYFTSTLRCVPFSETHWWNTLPTPNSPLDPNVEGSVGDRMCDHALALVFLTFFSLLTYILSLSVSLFRIFEKVKFREATISRGIGRV